MERKNEDKNQKKIRSVKVKQEDEEIYVRYYVGHKGKFGHEFLEFEFRPDGRLRYANNSNYKQDILIRKQVTVSKLVLNQVKKIIVDSGILNIDDNQ